MSKHFIFMSGEEGCIPAHCCALTSLKEACEYAGDFFDVLDQDYYTEARRRFLPGRDVGNELRDAGYVSFRHQVYTKPFQQGEAVPLYSLLGAGYCCIDPCDCNTPWQHEEDCDDYRLLSWLEWMSEDDELKVIDACNGYYAYRGEEGRCIGDGTYTVFPHPITGNDVECGETLFTLLWQRHINDEAKGTYIEAYFREEG